MDEIIYRAEVNNRSLVVVKRHLGERSWLCGYVQILPGDEYYTEQDSLMDLDPDITFVGKGEEIGISRLGDEQIFIGIDTMEKPYLKLGDVINELGSLAK